MRWLPRRVRVSAPPSPITIKASIPPAPIPASSQWKPALAVTTRTAVEGILGVWYALESSGVRDGWLAGQ
jgi:hypothetical protein